MIYLISLKKHQARAAPTEKNKISSFLLNGENRACPEYY
ncbi:unnamed protein product [Larinioides sclopetarius]|uniref:Uncharacterized protein n=1 Tax=Larinioides sclopetarius TaxID=280406 RepID=A0AAV2B0E1_9ARAC